MRRSVRTGLFVVALFLLALPLLVHRTGHHILAQPSPAKQDKKAAKAKPAAPQIYYGTEDLPEPVRDLRDMLLAAIQSGQIGELRAAYELNDIKPDLGTQTTDPVAHWKKLSGDGEGREVLAALSLILEAGYVVLPLGRDIENNSIYIWPYFAETPLDRLTPAQEVELLRLVPAAAAKDMKVKGRYTYWRLSIGADGSWHSFRKDE
jgi:hypothetical protein